MRKIYLYTLLACSLVAQGCEDFLQEEPVDLITNDQVIIDEESAEAVVLGAYSALQGAGLYGNLAIGIPGILSDELVHSGSFPTVADLDNNQVQAANVTITDFWNLAYSGIFRANTAIEALTGEGEIPGLTPDERAQLLSEARFIRALLTFQLSNLWGGVPIAISTDVATLSSLPRSSREEVLNFVITELSDIEDDFGDVDLTVYRANSWAARALLARVHLYAGNLALAGQYADFVIENGPYSLTPVYADLFDPMAGDNEEVIFRVFASANDQTAIAFWVQPEGRFEYAVGEPVLAAYELMEDTERALVAVNGGDPLGRLSVEKYTDVATGTDKPIVLRLAEMYLIRAEANASSPQAVADINLLRERAGVDPIVGTSVTLAQILEERLVELAFEGHRWYDLIRTGQVNTVLGAINPDTWRPEDALLPIPQYEIDQNSGINPEDQNPGY